MKTICFRKPSVERIVKFLATQANQPFTYTAVGATASTPPAGFVVDHTRFKLGEGESVFLSASAALRRWDHMHLGWVEASSQMTPIQPGATVAIMGRAMGTWWLNACRIVYVVDESGPICKFGFAYGTLPAHAECGEERFQIEWNRDDNSVWYDILAFSKPRHILARLSYPIVRRMQKKFARDSGSAMQKAVATVRQ